MATALLLLRTKSYDLGAESTPLEPYASPAAIQTTVTGGVAYEPNIARALQRIEERLEAIERRLERTSAFDRSGIEGLLEKLVELLDRVEAAQATGARGAQQTLFELWRKKEAAGTNYPALVELGRHLFESDGKLPYLRFLSYRDVLEAYGPPSGIFNRPNSPTIEWVYVLPAGMIMRPDGGSVGRLQFKFQNGLVSSLTTLP